MPRPFSAYAALDLKPGADRAAVEEAYRRLIKLHHPDRSGGDGDRAAEINRAYRELRGEPISKPTPMNRQSQHRPRRKRRRRFPRWPLIVAGLIVIALIQGDWLMQQGRIWAKRLAEVGAPVPTSVGQSVPENSLLDGPVDSAAVADSIEEALRLVKNGDEEALTQHSRDCHRQFRLGPNPALLDRCAAFDSAVAALQDLDPDHDISQFNASSVTARQMTAASMLTGDYLAIERRLNRIRSHVELALMPPELPPVKPQNLTRDVEAGPADLGTAEIDR